MSRAISCGVLRTTRSFKAEMFVFDEAAMLKRLSNGQEDVSCQPSQDSQAETSHVELEFPPSTSTFYEDDVIDENDSEANPPAH